MYSNKNKYKELLMLISDNISNKKHKKYVINNLDNLANKFCDLSKIINNLSYIILNNSLSYNDKVNLISKNLSFSTKQSQKIMNILKLDKDDIKYINQKGGFNEVDIKKTENVCKKLKIPSFSIKSIFSIPGNLFLYLKDCISKKDFKEPLDFVYIFLFISASVPFAIGFWSDFFIICKALMDKRYFLATMVTCTLYMSMWVLHIFDVGLLFKILYALDNYSYMNYSRINNDNENSKIYLTDNNIENNNIDSIPNSYSIKTKKNENSDKLLLPSTIE